MDIYIYPWIVECYPVFNPVSKSLEAEVGKVVEVVDHADVMPSPVFLLQHLQPKRFVGKRKRLIPLSQKSHSDFCILHYIWNLDVKSEL